MCLGLVAWMGELNKRNTVNRPHPRLQQVENTEKFIIMCRRIEVYMFGVNISSLHYHEIQCGVFHSFFLPHSFNDLTSCCMETLVFFNMQVVCFKMNTIHPVWYHTYKQPFIRYTQSFTHTHTHTHIPEQMYFLPAAPLPPLLPLSSLELLSIFLPSVHGYDLVFGRSCAHCITDTNM